MREEPTTVVIQRYLEALPGDTAAGRRTPGTRCRSRALVSLGGSIGLRGWALVERERSEEGMAQVRRGFDTGEPTRAQLRAHSLALLAGAWGKEGNFTEGLAELAKAFTLVEETGIRFYEPELHRLKGEFLLALDPDNPAEAEACFRQALAIARRHQAKSLEMCTTTRLARLWQRQGRRDRARAALAAVYGTYTEGFAMPDLDVAAAFLKDEE
jgi:predicted ATPase